MLKFDNVDNADNANNDDIVFDVYGNFKQCRSNLKLTDWLSVIIQEMGI